MVGCGIGSCGTGGIVRIVGIVGLTGGRCRRVGVPIQWRGRFTVRSGLDERGMREKEDGG